MNPRLLSHAVFAVALALTVVGLGLLFSAPNFSLPAQDFGFPGYPAIFAVSFSTVGWLVSARQPQNPLGWLFTAVGMLTAIELVVEGYALIGAVAYPGSLPGANWAAWIRDWIWLPPIAIAGFFILLLFPDGQLPSQRWRWVAWLGGVAPSVFTILIALAPGPLEPFGTIPNPAGIDVLPRNDSVEVLIVFWTSALLVISATLSLVLRFRHSIGATRQQLKWIAVAGALTAVMIIPGANAAGSASPLAKVLQAMLIFSIASIPAAAGLAILRHRLYDIDLVINRTALYGGVGLAIAAVFGFAHLVVQRLIESVTGERSEIVTVAVVALAALSYGPIRGRTAPLLDRLLPARAVRTLLFTDIVGSTARIVELGDERWRELLDRYRAAVRAQLAHYRGREVNTAGDAFFAVFDRPVAAIRCASAILVAVHGLALECRTGLHQGVVELRGEQVSGLTVHAAARVMSHAAPGEILISDALRAVVPDDLELVDRGQQELKGLPGEWQLYSITGANAPGP